MNWNDIKNLKPLSRIELTVRGQETKQAVFLGAEEYDRYQPSPADEHRWLNIAVATDPVRGTLEDGMIGECERWSDVEDIEVV